MSRISSLLVATGIAILPAAGFAQQTATPAQPAPSAPMNSTETKAPTAGAKTMPTQHTKSMHGKTGTVMPAKKAEPSKS